ncbi:transcriptional regulator [Natronospirillum operosum]|uniref:Transcriptional regulator n=1 Tax=Natronospirillum operosum TaxID=2759953 RepID=A0A4Z0WEU5_9GAMM|nr:helix-turn-helix domain-containing protein [Natronospirillum operosum]TGG93461.1 transcriptional regulator [Natronospirillum operosum]
MTAGFTNREKNGLPAYGAVRSPAALGQLFRAARKEQGMTLHDVHAASGLSMRFLSEFERGKPNVSLAKVMTALQILGLECLIFSRRDASRLLAQASDRFRGGSN